MTTDTRHPEIKRLVQAKFLLGVSIIVFVAIVGGLLSWQVSTTVHGESGNPLGELLISFGPAALFASGRGMVLPLEGVPAELQAFLQGQASHFEPRLLPETVAGPHIFGDYADTFTLTHWLLFYSVGWVWRLFGINIAALHLLVGVVGAFTALSLYLLFRLGMSRLTSCVGAVFTLCLPPFLLAAPLLRDFSKAPFILLVITLSAMLLIKKRPALQFHKLVIGLALLIGLGYGFRQDLLICLPIAAAAVLVAPLQGYYRLLHRFGAIAALLLLFMLLALPVFRGMRHESGSVTSHTLFQGISREAEQNMGFGDASYELLLSPSDPEVHAVVNAHARIHGMHEPMPLYLSPAYAQAGRVLFKEWVRLFPADFMARCIASMESTLRLCALTLESVHYRNTGDTIGSWRVFQWHDFYASVLEPFGLLFLFCAVLVIGLRSRFTVMAILGMLAYFMAYPNLLFQIRHAFHLSFIVPWAVFYLGEQLSLLTFSLFRSPVRAQMLHHWKNTSAVLRSMAVTTSILIVPALTCLFLLFLLRGFQAGTVNKLLEPYKDATLTPIETTIEETDGYCLVKPNHPLPGLEESWNLAVGDTATDYLALLFEPPPYSFPLRIQYQARRGAYMTRQITITRDEGAEGSLVCLLPLYELADFTPGEFHITKARFGNTPLVNLLVYPLGTNKFEGIVLRRDTLPFLKQVCVVEKHKELPWLLYLQYLSNEPIDAPFKRMRWEKNLAMLPVMMKYLVKGDAEKAIEGYFRLLDHAPGHRPYISKIIKLIPRLPEGRARAEAFLHLSAFEPDSSGYYAGKIAEIAKELAEQGDRDGAEYAYHLAITLAPEDRWHQTHLADLLLADGAAERAIGLYAEVLNAAPESPHSARQFDLACTQLEKAEYRFQFWKALHEARPKAIVPALHLAEAYEQLDRWDEAAVLYENILEHHEQHPLTLMRHGILLAATVGYTQGRAIMDEALALDPQLQPVFIEGLARVALAHADEGAHAFAEMIYKEIISLSRDNLGYPLSVADALRAKGYADAALALYVQILNAAPESPNLAEAVSALFEEREGLQGLLAFWQTFIHDHPDASWPNYHLGLAYEANEKRDEAISAYEKSLATAPDNALARQRLEVLKASQQ